MKKRLFATVAGLILATGVIAGVSSLSIEMRTAGPDTYADGTAVLPGETYLLVYCEEGCPFEGIYNDGSLVETASNRVAFAWQTTEPGRCSYIPVSYGEADYPKGGSWMIVLLDTRDSEGRVGGLCVGVGAGAAAEAGSVQSANTLTSITTESGGVSASGAAYARSNTPRAVITALKADEDKVNLRFKNFDTGVSYTVESTADLSNGQWIPVADRIDARSRPVLAGADGTPELSADVPLDNNATARFFRVVVPNVK
ncbi:MAG: hypothetical protein PHU80_08585 [Kiritimatiellae bacterium]|nr:hypothetical protein [Kiritimatiellia bacterium]